jgi:beta-lactamase class A
MHEYRNLARSAGTTNNIRQLPSAISSNKQASGQPRPHARSLSRTTPTGWKLFRCIEVATVLIFLQGQFLPSDHNALSIPANVQVVVPLHLTEEDTALEEKLKAVSELKGLHAGIFVAQPSSGRFANLSGKEKFSAASLIKFPILVSLLAAVDRGEVKKETLLTVREDLVTGGSGFLQWRPKGAKISVEEAAQLMMIISDNTATNLLIDHLGGKNKLNRQFTDWGLTDTKINNWLADLEGTNTTSPYDLVYLMGRVDRGDILSKESRNWLINVMRHTRIRTLLPQGLPPGTLIAHKTGDIGVMVGDAGLVTTHDGGSYLIGVQIARPRNDRRANLLIRKISKLVYDDFATAKSSVKPSPAIEPPVSPSEGPIESDTPSSVTPTVPHAFEAVQNTVKVRPAEHPFRRHRHHKHTSGQ